MAAPLPIETQFATAVLRKWGRPVTATSVRNVIGWMRAEGGHTHNKARFNFLNTTQPAPGAGNTGSQGNIKVYPNFQTGVDATVQTLNNGRYGAIAGAVNSDPSTFARAVNSTPWGTKSDFSGISRSLSVSGVSGGTATTDAGAVPPAASASLPQQSAGQLDVKRLREVLSAQTKRSLAGVMPAPGFRAELQKLAGQALPRALAVEGAQAVGTQTVGAAQQVSRPTGLAAGGGWGGTEAPIRSLARLASPFGLTVTSEKRTSPSPVAGTRSDHYVGNKNAYANDIGWGGSRPTPQSDRAASSIVAALGGPADWGRNGGVYSTTVNGIRYQVIYRSNVGGNHWNHIHVGARRV